MTAPHEPIAASSADSASPETLAAMILGMPPVLIAAGGVILRQGERSGEAFVLTEGTVRIAADTAYGAVPLATLNAPRLIGEIGALSGLPRTATVTAVSAVTGHWIPRKRLIDFGRDHPQFLISLIAQLGRQIEGTNRTLSLYSNALSALESRDFDPRILDELANPPPHLAEFSAAFRKFAREIAGKRRQQDELTSAAIIQQSYLPRYAALAGAGPGLELSAKMRPARNVGGDLYDFFMLDGNRLAFAIGDVCGKGIPASMFMAVALTVLRMSAREESGAEATMARTNQLLCKDNATSMFATLFYGVLDLRNGTLEYCNCGHNAPLVLGAQGGITFLPATGVPLGLHAGASAAAKQIKLASTDMLVTFTDGITEAMSPDGEEFTDERLHQTADAARHLAAEAFIEQLFRDVDAFARDAEQADDMTCLVLRCRP